MSHHIYTTEAFVIDSALQGEADKFFTLFTRDLGLVRAHARGVRLLRSKLRYSLQDYSQSVVSLVRGKDVWRLTNARLLENAFVRYRDEPQVVWVVAHLFSLVKRLVGDEEKNEELFAILTNAWNFLESIHSEKELIKHFEIICVLQILDNLGYMGAHSELEPFIRGIWSRKLLEDLTPVKARALKEINMSIRETQL